MNHLLRPRIWPSFKASSGVDPCDVPFSTPRIQHPAIALWHDHLCGLATAIHETSGQGLGSVPLFSTQIVAKQLPAVFVLVAVHAQVFPVRAVRGIVPVVPVFMVHSQ